ncbi:hypothetical protein JNW88_18680 [Micromonospora sp. ATA32]|nr:hypothetical protein [Micromonospora sp. ATA32]
MRSELQRRLRTHRQRRRLRRRQRPAYVDGPVRVVGSDIYDLDRDGDGIGCDT